MKSNIVICNVPPVTLRVAYYKIRVVCGAKCIVDLITRMFSIQ